MVSSQLKLIVTGASGFLGSSLALSFMKAGHKVALVVRPNSNLWRLGTETSKFLVVRCHNDNDIEQFIQTFDPFIVVHTACVYGRLGETITQISDSNLRFGLLLIQGLAKLNHSAVFVNTDTALNANINSYSLSKKHFAQWGELMVRLNNNLRFINVILQHMYGPEDDRHKFTSYVINTCRQNEEKLELTSGEQKRDFIFIDDVVSAYSVLLNRYDELDSYSDVEVGSGVPMTVRNFVELVHRLTSSSTCLLFGALPYRENELMFSCADLSIMNKLGWQPHFSIRSGLMKTISIES